VAADCAERWLKSGKPCRIHEILVRLKEHPALRGVPLSIQRGQAEALPLNGSDGRQWILKKFHRGRELDRVYLEAVSSLLPKHESFASGTERRVLSQGDLMKERGCYQSNELDRWLDGALLMPRVEGVDWATVADEVREGRVRLGHAHRLALCRSLTGCVEALEQSECSHRDISCGNVFVKVTQWRVSFIDFDSAFHSSLNMPAATTCGTEGYTAPFAWRDRTLDARKTWCERADRYALSIMCLEFLVLQKGSPLSAEGGMFDQEDLCHRRGQTLDGALKALRAECPGAVPLVEAAVAAECFDQCPSPEDWHNFCDTAGAPARPPRLAELEAVAPDFFEQLLRKRRPAAPLWPAPKLSDLPTAEIILPKPERSVVQLPPDPWRE